jgi:hypothetical protein
LGIVLILEKRTCMPKVKLLLQEQDNKIKLSADLVFQNRD